MHARFLRDPVTAARTVLAARPLRRSLLAYLLFNCAEWAVWVAALVFAYEYGGTPAAAAVSLMQLLPAAAVAPVAASLGDRMPRERMLALSYGLQASAMALTVPLFAVEAPPLLILAGVVLVSVTFSLSRPAYLASLPAFAATPSQLTAANSVSTMAESAAVLIGPAVAAGVMALAGPSQVFALFALCQLVAALLVLRPRPAPIAVEPATRTSTSPGEWLAGLRELRARPDGVLLLAYIGFAYLLVGMADVLAVVLSFEILELGPSGPGLLISAMGFGGILGAAASIFLAGRRHLGPALAGALFLAGAPFALTGFSEAMAHAVLLLAAAGMGKSFLDVASRTLLQRFLDPDVLSRVFGLQEGLMLLALAAGALLVPVFVALLGPRGAFVAAGLMLPLLAVTTWRRLARIDAEAPPPPRSLVRLRGVAMFSHLPVPTLEAVAARLVPLVLAPGESVIRQGEPGDFFYIVESGRLDVTVDGRPRPSLGPGDSFGEIALMKALPRTASVVTGTAACLWSLDRETFLATLTGSQRSVAKAQRVAEARLAADSAGSAGTTGRSDQHE